MARAMVQHKNKFKSKILMKNEKSSIPSNQEIFVPLRQPKKLQTMSTKTKLPNCRNRGEMNIHTLNCISLLQRVSCIIHGKKNAYIQSIPECSRLIFWLWFSSSTPLSSNAATNFRGEKKEITIMHHGYRIGWYWADTLFGGNLRRMYRTRAEGSISTSC